MRLIEPTRTDELVLKQLLAAGVPAPAEQPANFRDVVVLKPWGYELEVFDNGNCSLWLACLKPGAAVSLHCHQRKKALFVPLSDGITLTTLAGSEMLLESIAVDRGTFHSQENRTTAEIFFLEYEWPSEKADLVRFKDRYGREHQGYEGTRQMIPLAAARAHLDIPERIAMLFAKVA